MLEWLGANWGTILVVLILAVMVGMIVRKMIRDKKAGKSSCGAGCAGCAMRGACHKERKDSV